MRKYSFRGIINSLLLIAATLFFSSVSLSPASAATCSTNASDYLTAGKPVITNYGANYTNYPKYVYGGQTITFNLPVITKSGYSASDGTATKVFTAGTWTPSYGTIMAPGDQNYSFTQTVKVTWYDTATSTPMSCPVTVKWDGTVTVYPPQDFGADFAGATVNVYGSKQFGKNDTLVTFQVKAPNSGNQPLPNGILAFKINTTTSYSTRITNGWGSVSIPNTDLFFNVFNSSCKYSYSSGLSWWDMIVMFFGLGGTPTCSSNWYDDDGSKLNFDLKSNATYKLAGINIVSNLYFKSDNPNIWKTVQSVPLTNLCLTGTCNHAYPFQIAGPQPLSASTSWKDSVANYAANKNIDGASYAGETTFADSQFSNTYFGVMGGVGLQSSVATYKCNLDNDPACLSVFSGTWSTWANDINNETASGIGGKAYVLPNTVEVSGENSTNPLVLSCPVNSTGIRVRYIDFGQALWNTTIYSKMKANQNSIKFQINSIESFNGNTPIWDSPHNGIELTWVPWLSSVSYDSLHLVYADVKHGKYYNWEGGSSAAPWSCVLPASARVPASKYKIDYNMKITNDELGLAVYTTTQRPVLQGLHIWNTTDLKRRVFAKNVTVQVFKNTGTNAAPKKGAYVTGYDIPTKCLQYAGSTLSLPDARYKLGPGDLLNKCKYDITLKAMSTVGKYVAIVKWDGYEGSVQSYVASDSWTTTGAQARFAFEIVQEFQCFFDDTGAESIWVDYMDKNGTTVKTSKGAPFTVARSNGQGVGGNMLLTYPNVDANDFVGIIYDAPNITADMNGKIRAVTKIYDKVLTNGAVIMSTPREPEEVRLFKLDKTTEILRNGTSKYMFGDYEVLGLKKATSTGVSDELFHDNLRVYWPSTQNAVSGARIPLMIEREINVYGWAWSMGKAGQLELKKDWHTCLDSPRTGAMTVISSQVNQ